LGQRGKDIEDQLAGRRGRINRAITNGAKTDATLLEVFYQGDQVGHRAAQAIHWVKPGRAAFAPEALSTKMKSS
jgi:hypothetical protein